MVAALLAFSTVIRSFDVDLKVDRTAKTVRGIERIRMSPGGEPLRLPLKGQTVTAVSCGDRPAGFTSEASMLTVDACAAGSITIRYTAQEPKGITFTPSVAYTGFDSCTWMICDDNPSLPREGGDGSDGASGSHGGAGEGCFELDDLDLTTGRMSAGVGQDGNDGDDGSGGGGATSGAGFSVIANTNQPCSDRAGGSGGGGGSGGCGAPGAGGGGGGGSSIGIAVRLPSGASAGPSFERVRVVTASGGDGGDGGIGAAGGTGGAGGLGGNAFFFCARNGGRGGDGGPGGSGGGAGGGCGGSSYGMVLVGEPSRTYELSLDANATVARSGVAGRAGFGGFSPGNPGQNGLGGSIQDRLVIEP